MKRCVKVALVAVSMMLNGSYAELLYSQPFYQDAAADRPMQEYGWTTLNETTTGVVENATFTNAMAIGVGRGNGAPDVGELNATWPDGVFANLRGYPYMATANPQLVEYPTDSSGLYYTTISEVLSINDLGKLSLYQRADNTDSIMRFSIKIGAQWYASVEEFGGQNTGWTLKEMEEADFSDASKWVEITIDSSAITLGSNPASSLSGNIDAYGLFVNTGVTPNLGDHARFDNFQIYSVDSKAVYVAVTATDWTDPSAWSDGLAAATGTTYYATNSVVLETPATTTTFPGISLNLTAPQRLEIMASGGHVITIDPLTLDGADLAAGVVDAGEAKIDGVIEVDSDSSFSGATDHSRDLRILSLISGSVSVELSAPTKTIYIDNTGNSFNGTWVVSGGAAEFADDSAVGSASVEVQDNGTLRILGAWDGFGKGDSLTVADSPTALVDLGTNAWTVVGLTIGTNVVAEGTTYTAADLNAIGVNPVFTGSGTIQVGPPPPPPQPELIVGWERWLAGAEVPCPATIETNGITGTAVHSGFGISKYGGSNDGTFGGLLSPTASLDTSVNEEGMRVENATEMTIDFTVNNTSATDVDLGAFHFDALTKTKAGGPDTWTVEVLSGELSVGVVTSGDLPYIPATGNLADFDVDLTGLADYKLDAGGSVVFRVTFSGGTPASVGNTRLDVDNVAVTKVLVIGPVEPPVMFIEASGGDVVISWSESGFKLQSKAQLPFGEWVDYPGGDSSPVTVPANKSAEFLRLIQQ